jgi:hypothetical protein
MPKLTPDQIKAAQDAWSKKQSRPLLKQIFRPAPQPDGGFVDVAIDAPETEEGAGNQPATFRG